MAGHLARSDIAKLPVELGEGMLSRARRDMRQMATHLRFQIPVVLLSVGFAVAGALLPTDAKPLLRAVTAALSVCGGILVVGLGAFCAAAVRAPIRQRDEARTMARELLGRAAAAGEAERLLRSEREQAETSARELETALARVAELERRPRDPVEVLRAERRAAERVREWLSDLDEPDLPLPRDEDRVFLWAQRVFRILRASFVEYADAFMGTSLVELGHRYFATAYYDQMHGPGRQRYLEGRIALLDEMLRSSSLSRASSEPTHKG